ncbi:DUF4238 domain-containing protein [Burkholderia sp. Bp9017]|uniref:DUF4238 domain-containing protein n=1 Tax=unclassified Burkholderia TaxID=2613784 RepID=UPI000F5EF068|nr:MULTISPECIES: DUF4238 domain-containing protein [unclassified Burkholderia]RQZ31618.1 DUF4238 domain-containing protein [Burkholderia sp. Bp9017]RQZ37749.1 DUF4238 domain-containing protein [Burkholderia sp. Bp9016]
MSDLTRRQHYVPRVYLRRWAPDETNLLVTDKETGNSKTMSVADTTVQSWYYENPNAERDNELEIVFQEFEGEFGGAMRLFDHVFATSHELGQNPEQTMKSMLEALDRRRNQITRFAATLYFRTPGALEAKQGEVAAAGGPLPGLGAAIANAYEFTKAGLSSPIIDRLVAMRMCLLQSEDGFITSDRPCFDIDRLSNRIPGFGDELGINDDVVCLMPLTTHWFALYIPAFGNGKPALQAKKLTTQETGAFNDLVRGKARRWVVEIQK